MKPGASLDCSSMSITIASLSSGHDLRSTDKLGLDKIRHHLASEAFKRGAHTLSLERPEVYQDHEVIHTSRFKLPDSPAHLLGVTKQDEPGCLQLVVAALLGVESAAHVPVERFLSLCPGSARA